MGTWTSAEGEVLGAANLFVADASCLPALPGKSSTFTVMANADRIGRIVARR
jgi:choline dehydrogenase-like flavoprotein